jgi:hypothetical protein
MSKLARLISILSLLLLLACAFADAGPSSKSDKADKQGQKQAKKVVYVCACLKNKSCSCMTEAKMEGPCACGTEGGPPMKAVPADSDWAKENRDALAQ